MEKGKSAKAVGSNPTVNAIFFIIYFFIFSFSFFCLNTLFFLSVLHRTLFTNYDYACIIVKFKSSLCQIKLQVLYEFKLTQVHVYNAYNLRFFL